jgi:transposase-like protein
MEKQGTGAKQRSYTEEYKRQVVDLVVGTGRTATAVAAEVGVHPTLLCRWLKRYGPGRAGPGRGGGGAIDRRSLLPSSPCPSRPRTRRPRSRA